MEKSIVSTSISLFLILTIGTIFCFCSILNADEGEPIDVGSSCSDIDSTYHLTSDIQKTQWKLSELFAVPVGTNNPESWEQNAAFSSEFNARLQGQENAAAYAEACGAVWLSFFSENADVIVTLTRTITSTDQILQCISGIWVYSSTQYLQHQDVSDWITVSGSPFDLTNESSVSSLQTSLESLINDLNSQPGSESEPK